MTILPPPKQFPHLHKLSWKDFIILSGLQSDLIEGVELI